MNRSVGRWRFMRDDSSHYYLVPVEHAAGFDAWVESFDSDYEGDGQDGNGHHDYDQYRIDGTSEWSFADPKCDQ